MSRVEAQLSEHVAAGPLAMINEKPGLRLCLSAMSVGLLVACPSLAFVEVDCRHDPGNVWCYGEQLASGEAGVIVERSGKK